MSQFDYIKDLAKFGLDNDQEKLLLVLNELIEHSKKTKKVNFAIQLQSILKDSIKQSKTSTLKKVEGDSYYKFDDKDFQDLILEKVTSDYRLDDIVANPQVRNDLTFFIKEHNHLEILKRFDLPVANKILLHGPSGCGKTLASYVIAGELNKLMIVVNLGSLVSSRLGETSKNLAKLFRSAAAEDSIIFIDEFDSIGKVRDYSQDHGEMKRVVNTILQLFDYLPQSSIVIAATNQKEMLDDALLRRFDSSIKFNLPNKQEIEELIRLTIDNGPFSFDKKATLPSIVKMAEGLSFYSIRKTLVTAIKRSVFEQTQSPQEIIGAKISATVWKQLIDAERKALGLS